MQTPEERQAFVEEQKAKRAQSDLISHYDDKVIVLDGNDGTGKSTAAAYLREIGYKNVKDRGLPTKCTITGAPNPEQLPKNEVYFILDVPEEVSRQRIAARGLDLSEYWHTWEAIVLYRAKFREVAGPMRCHMIDATSPIVEVLSRILEVLDSKGTSTKYLPPNIDTMTQEQFEKLPLIAEGESKIIRLVSKGLGASKKDLVAIQFKPTVYSFTYNRAGIIESTDLLRMKCTRYMLDVVRAAGVKHSFWRVGDNFVLSERVDVPPPIEVIVKAFHVGTPKHRYFAMSGSKIRASHPTYAGFEIQENARYPEPFVRFDWRNPLTHPTSGKRLADEALCDEQADYFIDVQKARKTAKTAFNALAKFLDERDIVLNDICFMIDEDGETVYGEISQDCGRYQHRLVTQAEVPKQQETEATSGTSTSSSSGTTTTLESLDKDVWRAGGSSSNVVDKWKQLLDILEKRPWKETH